MAGINEYGQPFQVVGQGSFRKYQRDYFAKELESRFEKLMRLYDRNILQNSPKASYSPEAMRDVKGAYEGLWEGLFVLESFLKGQVCLVP